MTTSKLMSKSVFIVVVLLIAGVSSANIRTLLWDDPWCNTFSADGSCCLKCSYRCYMDKYGKCHPVSDFCNTWDNCTGACLTCYPGWGNPVNGVCPGSVTTTPPVDDHCAVYGYIDAKQKIYNTSVAGCTKICIQCDCDYYLTCDYKCVALPAYCSAADKYGNCTSCVKGYHVENGKCVVDVAIDHCIQYGYIDQSKNWLSIWSSGCKKVCKVCDCDYYLTVNYTCARLPAYCKSADIYGKCTDCVTGYHVDCGVCVADPIDPCAQYGWVDSNKKWYSVSTKGCTKVCKACISGYYLNCDNICVALPENCAEADSNGKCTKCLKGYVFNKKGDCIDPCDLYGWVDSNNKWYNVSTKGCTLVCKSCIKGYYLNSTNMCVQLPAHCAIADAKTGKCITCVKGFELDCNNVCVAEDPCEVYGWVDVKNKWYSVETKGCNKVCKCCKQGFYLNSNNKCIALPRHCKEVCPETGKCIKCSKGFKLDEGKCVVDDHCKVYGWVDAKSKWYSVETKGCDKVCKCCEDGYYLDCDNKCKLLPAHCAYANPDGSCKTCEAGYVVSNKVCVVKSSPPC